ncbi:unnamed protein product [Owenia fusiformis]|uniref:Chitin-binding type-2 domain-containing protein n=1 Tax=Owenia fusiformis TaxID=6347 RepID=A0A8S4PLN9_OWEFU|nr:unnamed protein product [Owenia fusiformis]
MKQKRIMKRPFETDDCLRDDGFLESDRTTDPDKGDCCSFLICDGILNKTGYRVSCMGGTVWNYVLKVCDDPKYFPSCNPSDCNVPSRTTELCGALNSDQCCVHGRQPIYTAVSGSDSKYIVAGERKENQCPQGEVFNLEDCCCESIEPRIPLCSDETDNYHRVPGSDADVPSEDYCCYYAQCFANGTGYDKVKCMPPSVWNNDPDVKSCDLPVNVPECMQFFCGAETTDPPCEGVSGPGGSCCQAGVWYGAVPGSDGQQYMITQLPDGSDWSLDTSRVLCCSEDFEGNQLIFNDDPDSCCCELPTVP